MNPATGQPWVLPAARRAEVARLLRADRCARQFHIASQVALIDRAAAEYRSLAALRDEIADWRGPTVEKLKRRATEKPWGFAAGALSAHQAVGRRRGRPPLTRERFALVFALNRVWPGRVRLSPNSTFVRVLAIVLQEVDGAGRDAYGIARRVNEGRMPDVGDAIEPLTLRDMTR